MTILKQLEDIAQWLRDNVASLHKFKTPPPDDEPITEEYSYKLAHPAVYVGLVPTIEECDSKGTPVQVAPSISVQLLEGRYNPAAGDGSEGESEIRLVFQLWNPGFHKGDEFIRNSDGWRDLWTLVDSTITEIARSRDLNGHHVHEDSLSFSPAKEHKSLVDSYPFFLGEVSFSVDFHKFVQPKFTEQL